MNVNNNLTELNENNLSIPNEWLKGLPENYRVMSIKGDGYTPHYLNGDRLLISLEIWRDNPSNVYLVNFGGKTELRKIVKKDNGTAVLESLSPFYPPYVCTDGVYDIIGIPYMLIRDLSGGDD